MGGNQSNLLNDKKEHHSKQYNWTYSLYQKKIIIPNDELIGNESLYIDLRPNFSNIENIDNQYLQVVKIVSYALNYSLLQSNLLEPFQVSPYYLYYFLIKYYGIRESYSFNNIQQVISKFGITSKSQYPELNEEQLIEDTIINKSYPFRHINILHIEPTVEHIKHVLNKNMVLLFGMGIFSNFFKTRDHPNLEKRIEQDIFVGGFAGVIVGYIENENKFIVLTSLGKGWGNDGYIYIPYQEINQNICEVAYIDLRDQLIQLDLNNILNTSLKSNDRTIF